MNLLDALAAASAEIQTIIDRHEKDADEAVEQAERDGLPPPVALDKARRWAKDALDNVNRARRALALARDGGYVL